MAAHRFLNPEGLAPAVGFSHVAVAAPGRLVFLAGETAHEADIVHRDELRRQGYRKWTALAIATLRTIRRYRGVSVRISAGDSRTRARTPFVFVGNNEYHVDGIRLGARDRLDAGRLFAYVAPRLRGRDLPGLLVLALAGRARAHQTLESFAAVELQIDTSRRRRLRVALDGEVAPMSTPLHYRVRPRALEVIVPAD